MSTLAGAAPTCALRARDQTVTSKDHGRAWASAARGGWTWISTSCSYVPPAPNGTRYTVGGTTLHQPSGSPTTPMS